MEVKKLPLPAFTYVAGACDSTIYFTDISSGNGGTITTWIWNYGDGNTDTLHTAPGDTAHYYATAGVFEVSLTTLTTIGCEATYTASPQHLPNLTPSSVSFMSSLLKTVHSVAIRSTAGNGTLVMVNR